MPDLEGRISCMSCGRSSKVKAEPPPAPASRTATGSGSSSDNPFTTWTPGAGQTQPDAVRIQKAVGRSVSGCLVGVVIAIIAASVAAVLLTRAVSDSVREATGLVSGRNLTPAGTEVLPVDESATEVLTGIYDGSADSRTLALVRLAGEGGEASVVWQSEEFPTGVYGGALAISGETAFAAVDDELWALDIADGTLAWKASLPDVVHTSCETCFTVVGDSLIVQTADAQVLAFGTDSSEARWGHRLVSPSGSVLVAGAGLAVIDDSPDQPGARQVQVLDPATGATVSTFVPVCDDGNGTRDLSFTDSVYALPGSPDLVATVSFGGGCAVRWNGTTGQVVWAAPVGDLGSPNRDGGLVTDTRLVVASSTGLSSIDLASGAVVAMAAPPDTSVSPVAQQGDLLVAQSATSRGTTKVGLVGYDAASGQIRWQAPVPGDSELLQVGATSQDALFAGAPRSLLITDGGDLSLATFDGEDRTISVSAVDPATGKPGEPVVTTLPARSGTPSVLVHDVRAGGLLFTIDSKVVHVGAGGEVVSFPEL